MADAVPCRQPGCRRRTYDPSGACQDHRGAAGSRTSQPDLGAVPIASAVIPEQPEVIPPVSSSAQEGESSGEMVPCANPEVCQVSEHVRGSEAHQMCERISKETERHQPPSARILAYLKKNAGRGTVAFGAAMIVAATTGNAGLAVSVFAVMWLVPAVFKARRAATEKDEESASEQSPQSNETPSEQPAPRA